MGSRVPAALKEVCNEYYKGNCLEGIGHWAEFTQDTHKYLEWANSLVTCLITLNTWPTPNKSTSSRVLFSCSLVNQSLLQFIQTLKRRWPLVFPLCLFYICVFLFSFSSPQHPRLLPFFQPTPFGYLPCTKHKLSSRGSELNNSRVLPFNYIYSGK